MDWIPTSGWLTKVAVDGTAAPARLRPRGRRLRRRPAVGGRRRARAAGATAPVQAPVDLSRLFIALAFVGVGLVGVGLIGSSRAGPSRRLVRRRRRAAGDGSPAAGDRP